MQLVFMVFPRKKKKMYLLKMILLFGGFAENVEFVDDVLTFVDLGIHLRSSGCHVAQLTSLDFSAKNGVGGCLKTLLRQFLTVGIDVSIT